MEFLKKHYEKIVLCVVLLGLAGAAWWLKAAKNSQMKPPVILDPTKTTPPKPMDLSNDLKSLAQVTNPPSLSLSGVHNLFNPVTWKRRTNGELFKVLITGPDALTVLNITPLFTVISYDRPADRGIYVIISQQHMELQQVGTGHKTTDYAKIGEKAPKSGLFIMRGIKGAEDNPDELNLEITQTGENVWISKDKPYKRVDSRLADLRYEPESKTMSKLKVDDLITLDNEPYKIIEITNNAVRVKSSTDKQTEIKWTEPQKRD